MKEMESKKRILEEAVDSLNEEIAKLKAKGIMCYRGYCIHFEIAGDLFGFVLQPCNLSSNLLGTASFLMKTLLIIDLLISCLNNYL